MPDRNLEKLLSGYSTHTLTPEERKALFEAALRDQVLFNALADEQALKELLEDPYSRRQLLAALEGMDRAAGKPWFMQVQAWFQRPFGWAVAGLLALADREPRLLFGIFMLFCCFEVFFVALVAILAEWLLEALARWTILTANLLAALAMLGYFFRGHRVAWREFLASRR